ncbi:MAG: hypothetical protein K8R76_09920 [Candidatus Aegiribacteria sp.]|nr:hypothetical protein [Candidatus Aegiribacteria sp.]
MIQIFLASLAFATFPASPSLFQGQLPSIVQNEDTLITETSSPVFIQTASISDIENLSGGNFGAAVIDLNTGDILASSGRGVFPVDDPDIFMLAYSVELMLEGKLDPDTLVGRNITIADEFWRAFHDCRESAARAMWAVGLESISSWVASKGMNDTELHDIQLQWEDAPATNPSLSSLDDITQALQIIHSGMDIPAVPEIMENPDMGDGQASSVGQGWDLYGWVDSGQDHKTYVLIAIAPDGRERGLVLLSKDLCCEGKGELAMMLLWQASLGL